MYLKDFILSNIHPVTDGQTTVMDCPSCGKGSKFTATVRGSVVLYNCYSSSCPIKGYLPLSLSPDQRIKALSGQMEPILEQVWKLPTYFIDGVGDSVCAQYMKDKNMWQAYKDGLFRPMYDPAERRFIFPIREGNEVVGAIGRSMIGSRKTHNYNPKYTKPFTCGEGEQAILVEDCASAVAASRNKLITGVALLGTSLRDDFIPFLCKYSMVHIALDKDAYSKSLKLRSQLSPYLKALNIVRLEQDIKDMKDSDYDRLFH